MSKLVVPEKYDQIFELYLIIGRGGMETDLKWCQKRFDKICSKFSSSEKMEFRDLQIKYLLSPNIGRYKTVKDIPSEFLLKI